MPFKQWISGELVTAADMNTYVGEQVVLVFADAAGRDAAIPSPQLGMHAWLTGVARMTVYDGTAWVRPYVDRIGGDAITQGLEANDTGDKDGTGTALARQGIRYYGGGHGVGTNLVSFGYSAGSLYASIDGGALVLQLANVAVVAGSPADVAEE